MLQNIQRGSTKAAAVFTAVCAAVWAVLAAVFLALPLPLIAGYLAFTALGAVIPGVAIYKLFNLRLTPVASLACAYSFGLLAVLAVYFLLVPLGFGAAVPYAMAALCALSLFSLYKTRARAFCGAADEGELRLAAVFCGFALLATFVTLSMATLDPRLSTSRAYYHDMMYGVDLCMSVLCGFLMKLLSMSGIGSWYHIFYFAYCAVMKLCLGADSFTIVTKLSLITISPLLAASFAAFAKKLLKKDGLAFAACFVMLAIPCASNIHYFYQDTLGYSLGTALTVLSVFMFFTARERGGAFNRYYAASSLLLVGAVSAKGPLAASVLFCVCFVLLCDLIRDRDKTVFARGLLYAVPFLIAYSLLYLGGGSGVGFHAPWDTSAGVAGLESLSALPVFLFRIIVCARYALCFYPTVSALFGFTVLGAVILRKSKEPRDFNIFCISGTLLGFVLITFVHQTGESERYFILSMLPFLIVSSARAICGLVSLCGTRAKRIAAACACALALLPCAVADVKNAAFYYWNGGQLYYTAALHDAIYYSRFSQKLPLDEDDRGKGITVAEYEAMIWLRDNTPEDSIIADGRYLIYNKFFSNSAFCERAFFLEGWGYVTDEDTNEYTDEKVRRDTFLRTFFESGDEGFVPLLAREGCDYLVIDDYLNPGLRLSEERCELVYENDEIRIYQLDDYELE